MFLMMFFCSQVIRWKPANLLKLNFFTGIFLEILTTDSYGNFKAIFKKFSKMATVISKNTFFSRTPPVAASINLQN